MTRETLFTTCHLTMAEREALLNAFLSQDFARADLQFPGLQIIRPAALMEDLKVGLEREIKELYRQIREARRAATAAPTLQEKLEAQKHVKSLEAHRNTRRRAV